MKRADLLASARLAGQVLRYHTWPFHRHQSVAEHTWQMIRIWMMIWGLPSPYITAFIMCHDAGELVTGDPPFPFKAKHPDIKKAYDLAEEEATATMGLPAISLNGEDRRRVKVCDLIEMWEYGLHEKSLGNLYAQPIIEDTHDAILKLARDMSPKDVNAIIEYRSKVREEFPCTL